MINVQSLQITPDILALVSAIDEFKGAWRASGLLAPERLLTLRRVAAIEGIGASVRMEGGRPSNAEVGNLLSQLEIKALESRDEQMVAGYAVAMEAVVLNWATMPLTKKSIKQLHRDLLFYSETDHWHRGSYKTSAVNSSNGDITPVKTVAPFDAPRLMTELVDWFTQVHVTRSLHPLLAIAIFIAVFLEISPFQSSNGSLSRLLMTLLLLQAGYSYVPYISLENVIEQSKDEYSFTLHQTQTSLHAGSPNWQPWLLFFLRTLHWQMKRLEVVLEREKSLLAKLPELSVRIMNYVKEHGRIAIADAVILTGASRNTLKEHFRSLAKMRLLSLNGSGRGAWYALSS